MLSSSIKTSVILLAAAALLAGCVSSGGPGVSGEPRDSDGPRDSGGNRMQLTEWQDAPMTDILFNLADLGDISDATLATRVRDGSIPQQVVRLGSPRTYFYIEHLPNKVYGDVPMEQCLSEEYFRTETEERFQMRKKAISIEGIGHIRKHGRHSGFIAVAKATETGESCTVGRICFLGTNKNKPRSDERFDSFMNFDDCTGRLTFDELKAWLPKVDILPQS